MKQYESYKDSGIEWLGKIPSHWTAISMKFYFYMKGRIGWQGLKADEFISDGPYLVTGTDFDNGRVDWSRCYHISEERYAEAPEIHVKEGDLLITKDGTVGKLAYVDHIPGKVSLNSHLLILRPLTENVSNHFMYWALQADNFVHYTGLAQSGSIMASLSQEKIGNYKLALPSISEQRIIASYLHNRVSQIDTIIAEKEMMIEDLQNYRKSIISEAVTHGIDPNVQMKDSGNTQFENIPSHWKLEKLKYTGSFDNGLTYSPEDVVDDGLLVLRSSNIQNDKLSFDDCVYVKEAPSFLKVKAGDIIICSRNGSASLVGKCVYIDDIENATFGAFMMRYRPNIFGKFAFYAFQHSTSLYKGLFSTSTINQLTMNVINQMYVAVPPIKEQEVIANYIDKKINSVDFSISELQSQIEDLKAYKSSLITEAVTGKIDLRNE